MEIPPDSAVLSCHDSNKPKTSSMFHLNLKQTDKYMFIQKSQFQAEDYEFTTTCEVAGGNTARWSRVMTNSNPNMLPDAYKCTGMLDTFDTLFSRL